MSVQQAELPEIVEWRETLESLFREIRAWLAEMEPAPIVEDSTTQIIEKKSGEYEAPMLVVKRGEGEFRVQPIARWVVGEEGRVDMIGGDGPFILVRAKAKNDEANGESTHLPSKDVDDWCWVQDHRPWKGVQLTGELFRDLAESCLE